MTSMTHTTPQITGGVDTHGQTHHAAVIDSVGRHLADQEFPATIGGYRDLLDWMRSHGTLVAVGVEGTGTYGAELAPGPPRASRWSTWTAPIARHGG
jgi:transposase